MCKMGIKHLVSTSDRKRRPRGFGDRLAAQCYRRGQAAESPVSFFLVGPHL